MAFALEHEALPPSVLASVMSSIPSACAVRGWTQDHAPSDVTGGWWNPLGSSGVPATRVYPSSYMVD